MAAKSRREGTLIKREIRVESVAVVISEFRLLVVRSSSLARFFSLPVENDALWKKIWNPGIEGQARFTPLIPLAR